MDHRVQLPKRVDLTGEVTGLFQDREVRDQGDRALRHQVLYGGEPLFAAHMDDHLVTVAEKRLGGGLAQAVR
ncbi:hypothetical protein KH5H1_54790 [Corallococcus caeni]|nr:hypothetical protein KH5H1_54790 [Corallococcus sp. KH5-1]